MTVNVLADGNCSYRCAVELHCDSGYEPGSGLSNTQSCAQIRQKLHQRFPIKNSFRVPWLFQRPPFHLGLPNWSLVILQNYWYTHPDGECCRGLFIWFNSITSKFWNCHSPESIYHEISRLNNFPEVDADFVCRTLRRDRLVILDLFPVLWMETLKRLGFIDSLWFQILMVPGTGAFAFAIRAYRAILQPFPVEMIELLMIAQRIATEQVKQKISAHVEVVKEQFKGLFDVLGLTKRTSQVDP